MRHDDRGRERTAGRSARRKPVIVARLAADEWKTASPSRTATARISGAPVVARIECRSQAPNEGPPNMTQTTLLAMDALTP